MRRRAFTLMELMAVTLVLEIVIVMSGVLFRMAIKDLPRACEDHQTAGIAQNFFAAMRSDAANARTVAQDGADIVLGRADGQVRYRIVEGGVARMAGERPPEKPAPTWPLPRTTVSWRLMGPPGAPYAVAVQASIDTPLGSGSRVTPLAGAFFVVGEEGGQ